MRLIKGIERMPHAFILGGNGQIGVATASHLLDSGWTVTIAHRGLRPVPADLVSRGANVVNFDRDQPGALARCLSSGADALIDAVAYGPQHARQLLDVQRDLGSLIVISSSSVYRDEKGRTLDEAAQTGFPELPVPITESQTTVEPSSRTYSTRKAALEQVLLDRASVPATVLRPAAVSGVGSTHAREWWFVKRVIDGRRVIPLAYGGQSRFHTTSVANIAALVRLVASLRGQRILNIADPAALSVSEIAASIISRFDWSGDVVALPDEGLYPPSVGRTPWSVQRPFVLDIAAATSLGYRPQTDYLEATGPICSWLVQAAAGKDGRVQFPALAAYPYDLFDYQVEDALLARLR
jgi:nucleoside-diphosphate-sugar epimerase